MKQYLKVESQKRKEALLGDIYQLCIIHTGEDLGLVILTNERLSQHRRNSKE